jgi:thiol-disulfide isomerase/thioredoxin
LPKLGGFKAKAAPDGAAPNTPPAIGVGKWVWMNLWAAWCGPCKEEMPRLLGWKKKLEAQGVSIDLDFVSLDDDERQLTRFLEAQPKDGVRASLWLPEGDPRTTFLHAAGLKDTVELPVQAFFAPSGDLACVVQGAVDDRDWPAIVALVGKK